MHGFRLLTVSIFLIVSTSAHSVNYVELCRKLKDSCQALACQSLSIYALDSAQKLMVEGEEAITALKGRIQTLESSLSSLQIKDDPILQDIISASKKIENLVAEMKAYNESVTQSIINTLNPRIGVIAVRIVGGHSDPQHLKKINLEIVKVEAEIEKLFAKLHVLNDLKDPLYKSIFEAQKILQELEMHLKKLVELSKEAESLTGIAH